MQAYKQNMVQNVKSQSKSKSCYRVVLIDREEAMFM